MGTVRLELGDCLDVLKTMDESSVDSIVTDPPYELGFMGKEWDSTGIANNVELWRECLRVLKPGGHLLAFSGTRTYHRMASAIEDAGFEVRDMIEWVYSTGFPKSLNIGKAVDKLQGNEREVVGKQTNIANKGNNNDGRYNWNTENQVRKDSIDITKGTSEWEGWGTALKPAHEPIVLARKPLSEKSVAENVLKHGTGGLNIDGSRVEGIPPSVPQPKLGVKKAEIYNFATGEGRNGEMSQATGRFPANLIHDGSEEVVGLFPNDSARFFYSPKASKSERNMGCEGMEEKYGFRKNTSKSNWCIDPRHPDGGYELKYSPQSNHHPTVKPVALMEYLVKLVSREGHTVLDPFLGSGSTGIACVKTGRNFIGIEREAEYLEIAKARIAAVPQRLL